MSGGTVPGLVPPGVIYYQLTYCDVFTDIPPPGRVDEAAWVQSDLTRLP